MELTDLKLMLQLKTDAQDDLLQLIISNTTSALNFKLGTKEIPYELEFILLEVCVRRYNRLNNEGMTSYAQEGETITFNGNDFSDYAKDIDDWKNAHDVADNSPKGMFVNPYRKGR